ncbi:RNA polymerase II subunit A C-terminal domain phosphatase [Aspergillus saccharolyticus JOP 1030-1]|uniref:RNA polymerase II subunit A C-terminal domain phosphatase SSU72 n=1 Tax=Aspergillus saccharolyticus JOP 1030-1 TaxID=1450539 RepID=A0A319AS31_9EURO|nr:transcription/RNA-processing factor Ssu72 [Aspergillus saccharolyticus JOP 1030-1]PYH49092.1 transcription/RNA-processing factor Ssu72 [Aspergillus saccharolyticus JOP 1030-1]
MAYDPRLVSSTSTSAGTASTATPPPPPPPPLEQHQPVQQTDNYKLRFCTVCASNQNRSMEAHLRLSTATPSPFPVISFGTGSLVRLPGPTVHQPNIYHFNTTSYTQMYEELQAKDERLYRYNGLLNMLDRNRNLKWGPERFQDWVPGVPRVDHVAKGDKGALGTEGGVVDVIITCEERCWDAVVDDLMAKGAPLNRPVHVFNVDIKDNHEEALVGGKAILELANWLNEAARQERRRAAATAAAAPGGGAAAASGMEGWENGHGEARRNFDERVPEILAAWQEKWPHLPALWTLAWL